MADHQILIYGYGNPGRQDDGLGNAFVEKMKFWVEKEGLSGFEFDSNYQLNIEDAASIAEKDLVIFVDASIEKIEDFLLTPIDEKTDVAFTSHSASPGYIFYLSKELFGKQPPAYLLHIKGYHWDFAEGLSDKAKENLEKAFSAMKNILSSPNQLIESFKNTN